MGSTHGVGKVQDENFKNQQRCAVIGGLVKRKGEKAARSKVKFPKMMNKSVKIKISIKKYNKEKRPK